MDKLYPIVRRVRRPLLPPDHEPVSREGTKAAKGAGATADALREEDAIKPAEEVSGETPDTTPGTAVLPENEE